jgi:hypothetical protein
MLTLKLCSNRKSLGSLKKNRAARQNESVFSACAWCEPQRVSNVLAYF